MENQKSNKGLYVVISILCILVLLLGGYIVYDKTLENDAEINENNSDTTIQYTDNSIKSSGTKQEVTVKKNEITDEAINRAFDIIGLPRTNSDGNYALNYYISNNDYNKYTSEIISYYANTWDDKSLFKTISEEVMNSDACGGSGYCMSIAKEDAEEIFALYNFSGNFSDYFKTTSLLENEYVFIVYNTAVPVIFNSPDANIKHDIDIYNMTENDIEITDTQTITLVDEDDFSKLKTIDKVVKYEFKMNDNGDYYLYKLTVK